MKGQYAEDPTERPEGESRDERDRRMDSNYVFDRGPDVDLSVLAIVSQRQDEFADEFFRWWENNVTGDKWQDAMRRWEVQRFGARLFLVAHQMLAFAVKQRMVFGPPQKKLPPQRPQITEGERQKRFDEAAGRAAREKSWPGAKRSSPEELAEQARTILTDHPSHEGSEATGETEQQSGPKGELSGSQQANDQSAR